MSDLFGGITNPMEGYGNIDNPSDGLSAFISNILNLIALAGGLLALLNMILGGLSYITSQGDPESVQKAQKKIYMSLVGLVIIVGSYAIIAIVSRLFFGSFTYILSPIIQGPGTIE